MKRYWSMMLVIILTLCSVSAYSEEMITIPRSALEKIRDYVIELQSAYNFLVDELYAKDMELEVLYNKIEIYKRRSSGLWLGAAAGIPFPSASVQGEYIINNNIGFTLSGGYSNRPYIQGGIMVRVGK